MKAILVGLACFGAIMAAFAVGHDHGMDRGIAIGKEMWDTRKQLLRIEGTIVGQMQCFETLIRRAEKGIR